VAAYIAAAALAMLTGFILYLFLPLSVSPPPNSPKKKMKRKPLAGNVTE
jgi:hypothetical protein